jgi:Flp pilus assembly protein TadG
MGNSSVESHCVRALSRTEVFRVTARRFVTDESGSHAIMAALLMPVLVGATAYGVETATLLHKQKSMQHAADSAALTAAVAVTTGANDNGAVQGRAVAASYGFPTAGTISVQVNSPPTGGPSTNNRQAIEVIISQPQPRLFSSIWGSSSYTVGARAVAKPQGQPCILALNQSASGAYSQQGSVSTNLINCSVVADSSSSSALSVGGSATLSTSFAAAVGGISGQSSITATYGTKTGYHYVADPYADVSYPSFSGCDKNNYSTHGTDTLSPGVYCGGMNLSSGAAVTLNPGIYYLDRGDLSMAGQSSLRGNGVTLVFTSSTGNNYATAKISGGATLSLAAPTTGPTAGIAIFGDRNMPVGTTFKFTGGDSQAVGGAVYVASAALQWAGNATVEQHCTQIIADTVQLVGNSGLQIDCTGYGTRMLSAAAQLLE